MAKRHTLSIFRGTMRYKWILIMLVVLALSGCKDNTDTEDTTLVVNKDHTVNTTEGNATTSNDATTSQGDAKRAEEHWVPVIEFYEGADGSSVTYKGKLNVNAFDYLVRDTSTLDTAVSSSVDLESIKETLMKSKEDTASLTNVDKLDILEPALGWNHNGDTIFATVTFTYINDETKSSLDVSNMTMQGKTDELTTYTTESSEIAVANDRTWELANAYYLVSEFYLDVTELSLDEISKIQQLKSMYVLTSYKGLSAVILTDDFDEAKAMALQIVHNIEYLEMSSTSS